MFQKIFDNLINGILPTDRDEMNINKEICYFLNNQLIKPYRLERIKYILQICNTIYNCTDLEIVEDGIYDLLLEKYKKYDKDFQVGSKEIDFKIKSQLNDKLENKELKVIMRRLPKEKEEKMLYADEFNSPNDILNNFGYQKIMTRDKGYINKRNINTKHNYPKLVGSLDKVKFVTNYEAVEKGVYNDSNVKILERDFFQYHIKSGILDPNRTIRILLELKEDGISVEADVNNIVQGARSRGDANNDIATDLTPILQGYEFPNVPSNMWNEPTFGMKFEAIIRWFELNEFNRLKNYNYKNCRTGVIGLFSGSDAWKYRDLVTLIPLATSLEGVFKDRVEEIEFMNKFYATREKLRYTIVEGNLTSVLFQIKRFVEEAEYMRQYMGYMYDGVVVSYLDQDIIDKLPRSNSINKHTIAVKFNPEKKSTTFRGYTYEVGQNGEITPMLHFDPIEFFGTIHTKASAHSYDRFKKLDLREGNVLDFEYVNDVMPYATKPDNHFNAEIDNNILPIEFITECPKCKTKIIQSKTGKTMICPNLNCSGRKLSRIVNMFDKLNIKDFAEASIEKINIYSLTDLFKIDESKTKDVYESLGLVNGGKFINAIEYIKNNDWWDYEILGALGFDGIAKEKWKTLLKVYTLQELIDMSMDDINFKASISNIKGLGPETANTISTQFEFFIRDIFTILSMKNIKISKGSESLPKIRMTGFRDKDLIEIYKNKGYDIGEGSVTKDTNILLVPTISHNSSKVTKAKSYGVTIMGVDEFRNKY